MGSSDLNLKKSWHVGRAANITAKAKAEATAIEERKKTAARLSEIREERKKEEIQRQLAAATGKVVQERVEWMYTGGPSDGQNGDSAVNEGYLLGKRSLTKLFQENDTKKLLEKVGQDSSPTAQMVSTARDTATKIRADPLLAIKRKEQEAYEAVMRDPIKRRQLLASMGINDSNDQSKNRGEKHHKRSHHDHRRHRHREEDSDEERRSQKRRRYDSRDRSTSRKRWRYDSRDRSTSRKKHYDLEDEERHRGRRGDDTSKRDHGSEHETGKPNNDQVKKEADEDKRARKLAAMQDAASDLDKARERRLAALEEADRAAREAEDEARQRASKLGGDRHFMNNLRRKAGDMDLAERIGRGRQGLQRDEE